MQEGGRNGMTWQPIRASRWALLPWPSQKLTRRLSYHFPVTAASGFWVSGIAALAVLAVRAGHVALKSDPDDPCLRRRQRMLGEQRGDDPDRILCDRSGRSWILGLISSWVRSLFRMYRLAPASPGILLAAYAIPGFRYLYWNSRSARAAGTCRRRGLAYGSYRLACAISRSAMMTGCTSMWTRAAIRF